MDLEKAYDRVCWDFLRDTLLDAGLLGSLVGTIMCCVFSSSIQLLWNGNLSEEFVPSRGLRQGDPLSPYLFVLGVEKLGHLIEALIEDGSRGPMMLIPLFCRRSLTFWACFDGKSYVSSTCS